VGVLQRFERRIEEMVNRPFARAFKAEVQPVEIASALQRECDDRAAIVARGRTMVPNTFVVELGDHDHDRLSVYAEALGSELAAMVREHAKEQGYSFLGPVMITFEQVSGLGTGQFRVRSSAVAGPSEVARPSQPVGSPSQGIWNSAAPPATGSPGRHWVAFGDTTYPLAAAVTRVGRGADSDIRLEDPGVSRNHAEIRLDGDDATVRDAGSTNGVVVDGERVLQARLEDGSTIVLGNSTLVFHRGTG
jgi:hypothetical protein